jgi:hypothetical protein
MIDSPFLLWESEEDDSNFSSWGLGHRAVAAGTLPVRGKPLPAPRKIAVPALTLDSRVMYLHSKALPPPPLSDNHPLGSQGSPVVLKVLYGGLPIGVLVQYSVPDS